MDNRSLGEGGTRTFVHGRHWARPEGHGGRIVPEGERRALREDRTGAWSDLNTTSTTGRRTRRRQTLWLDHGTDPVDAGYVHVLMPGASRRAVTRRAADRHRLTVLANDDRCQAVAARPLGLTAANFWRAGTGPLTATAGASVPVRRRGRTATLSVSEPPRTGAPLEIVWDHPVGTVVRADETVGILTTGRRLRLRVTPGTVCATHECEVTLS